LPSFFSSPNFREAFDSKDFSSGTSASFSAGAGQTKAWSCGIDISNLFSTFLEIPLPGKF